MLLSHQLQSSAVADGLHNHRNAAYLQTTADCLMNAVYAWDLQSNPSALEKALEAYKSCAF